MRSNGGTEYGLVICRVLFAIVVITLSAPKIELHFGLPLFILSLISGGLMMYALEKSRYDPRSSLSILLLFCCLYFYFRVDFGLQERSAAYLFVAFSCLLFLAGLILGLTEFYKPKMGMLTARAVAFDGSFLNESVKYRRLIKVSWFSLAVSFITVIALLKAVGAPFFGIEIVFSSLKTRLAIADRGLSFGLQIVYFTMAVGLGTAFVGWIGGGGKLLPACWLVFILYFGLAFGSRGAVVLPLLQLLLAYCVLARRPFFTLGLVLLPFVIMVQVFSGWFLGAREGRQIALSDSYSHEFSLLSRFDAIENWIGLVAENGQPYSPMSSIPAALLQVVPRRLMEEKPYYFSTEMTRSYLPEASERGVNLDFGGIAESMYNFGVLGPPLFGLFLAFIVSSLDRLLVRSRLCRSATGAYLYAYGALIPASFFFVGWINSSMIFVLVNYVFVYIFMRWSSGCGPR